uniref:Protein phosphatase, Mg2+/Mn2+ dependent, 1H n=1 Tax=Gasterosteus aculeatus aculeatus TaxID=481459 RepID=A0AAQ4PK72_GASAC
MATLAPGRPWWLPAFCITTSPCTFRRLWRSSAVRTCRPRPASGRSPSTSTSRRHPSAPSPGPRPCAAPRGLLAPPAPRPHASSRRRRFHTRAWWSEPSRTLSKTWTCRSRRTRRSTPCRAAARLWRPSFCSGSCTWGTPETAEPSSSGPVKSSPCQPSSRRSLRDSDCSSWPTCSPTYWGTSLHIWNSRGGSRERRLGRGCCTGTSPCQDGWTGCGQMSPEGDRLSLMETSFLEGGINGRAYKTIEDDDLKFPLIYGEGKKARVLATIGVTRGLGDHNLKVHDSNIYIKPFLSCCPEVKVYPLAQCEHGADDVLVLGTDGLWDVLSNQEVAEAITCFLANCDPDDPHRYTMAAQDLVMRARGVLKDRGWRISNDRLGSGDDISVYIIPLVYGNKQN